MHVLSIFTLVAILTSFVLSETNTPAPLPSCTQLCTGPELGPVGCDESNLTTCLCTNTTLQSAFAKCVMKSCNNSDQAVTLTILQTEICNGVPQQSRSVEIIRDVIIIAAVTFPVVVLRFVSRSMVANKIGWDDWAVGLCAIIMIPMIIIPILNATRGFGNHFWNVPPQNLQGLRKLYYVSQVLYIVLQALAKISILFLYLRVFTNKRFRLATSITIAGIVAQTTAFAAAVTFQCTPVNSYWDFTIPGKCIHSLGFVYSVAGISIFEDFLIMFLPLWELKGLQLNSRKKFALGFIFALGSFACITSMMRLKYLVTYGASIDLTYDNVDVIIWSVLETFTAVICTSLMCFRPLVGKLIPSIFYTSKNGSNYARNPIRGQATSTMSGKKSRRGSNRIDRFGIDNLPSGWKRREIRVETTLMVKSSHKRSEEGINLEKLVEEEESPVAIHVDDL